MKNIDNPNFTPSSRFSPEGEVCKILTGLVFPERIRGQLQELKQFLWELPSRSEIIKRKIFEHHSLPLFTYLGVSGDIFAPIRTSILRAYSTLLGMPRIQEVLKEEIIEKFGKG